MTFVGGQNVVGVFLWATLHATIDFFFIISQILNEIPNSVPLLGSTVVNKVKGKTSTNVAYY